MLFLIRSDKELGIKRVAETTTEIAPSITSCNDVGATEEISPPEKKKRKKKARDTSSHNTNKIFIKDVNRASEDYLFKDNDWIIKNTEKILYIDSKAENKGDDPEIKKKLRDTFREQLSSNLEDVYDRIHKGTISVNSTLRTNTFKHDCNEFKLFSNGMIFKVNSRTKNKDIDPATAATTVMGEADFNSVSPVPQSGMMMDGYMDYDDNGWQHQQQQQARIISEEMESKPRRGRKKGKYADYLKKISNKK